MERPRSIRHHAPGVGPSGRLWRGRPQLCCTNDRAARSGSILQCARAQGGAHRDNGDPAAQAAAGIAWLEQSAGAADPQIALTEGDVWAMSSLLEALRVSGAQPCAAFESAGTMFCSWTIGRRQ